MVNSIHVSKDGQTVLTADATGFLKTWDIRTGLCVHEFLNEPTKKPISHIAVCPVEGEEEDPGESKMMAVNSYDNIMRVYNREIGPSYSLQMALKGYINKNWPIKSSFYSRKEESVDRFGTVAREGLVLLATGSADPHVYIYDVSPGKVCFLSSFLRSTIKTDISTLKTHT